MSTSSSESGEESEEEELNLDEDGRVALSGGSIDYAAHGFDGALLSPSAAAHDTLLADCARVFTARETGVGEELSAGCTFWTQSDAKPKTALERLALDIFRFHTRNAEFDASSSGAEWWTQVIDPEDDIGLHWDRDYDMQADQGLLLHPHVATVTYLTAPGAAAPTLVLDCPSPLLADETPCGPIRSAVACYPSPGRHFCFDGRLLHGAMSDLTPPPATATAKPPGGKKSGKAAVAPQKRVTFLVNVWLNHAPWGAEELPSVVRKQLNKLPGVELRLGERKDAAAAITPVSLTASAGSSRASRWTFGEAKAKLALTLPWPQAAIAATLAAGGAPPPVLELAFAHGEAELAPARQSQGASGKKKRTGSGDDAADAGRSAGKRKK